MKSYTINLTGQHYVEQFARLFHKRPVTSLEPFFDQAESAANDAFERGMTATIEIRSIHSATGDPHVLRLDEQWFDAHDDDLDDLSQPAALQAVDSALGDLLGD